jgi:hypothetical protein
MHRVDETYIRVRGNSAENQLCFRPLSHLNGKCFFGVETPQGRNY